MSLISKGIGLAKKFKNKYEDKIKANTPVYISPVRRINGVKSSERVCAMTFDDGPCMQNPNPDNYGGPLTLCLLETLERCGAKGTFDCIGDTSENYPDVCGREGTAMWGGVKYDHYPDFGKDALGGVKNCPELVKRILEGGHEIANHSYLHRIWGAKSLIYGKRKHMESIDEVITDLTRLHSILKNDYDYEIKLSRPPHYVDRISRNFTSYDAYAMLGYQYLGAGPDGGGWLPGADYKSEVEAMLRAVRDALKDNPDAFCGAIIFQKDGCNMLRRTPVADALELQLNELDKYGYRVLTVSELMLASPFEDIGPEDEGFAEAKALLDAGCCPAFSDNCVHYEKAITEAEAAMVLFGWEAARSRVIDNAGLGSAYKYALNIADRKGVNLKNLDYGSGRLVVYKALADSVTGQEFSSDTFLT